MELLKKLITYTSQLNVLYVEDDPMIRTNVETILKRLFKTVFVAENGLLGLESYRKHLPDLVITDISMPKMDGISMLQHIYQENPKQHAIVTTALTDTEHLLDAIDLGVDSFIVKPFVMEVLARKIHTSVLTIFEERQMIRIEQERDAFKQQSQNYFDLLDRGSIVSATDPGGIITYVNDAFCSISGYDRDELIGKSHNIVRHPDMPDSLFRELWQTLGRGEPFSADIKNRDKSGKAYWVKTLIEPTRDREGSITGYMSIRQDITKEVEALETYRQIEATKSELIRNVSHELRTPLNGILGMCDILLKKEQDEKKRSFLDVVRSSGRRIHTIVERILLLSQLNSNMNVLGEPVPIDLSDELSRVLENLPNDKPAQTRLHIAPSMQQTHVGFDREKLILIMNELLDNAIRFNVDSPVIDVTVDMAGDACIIGVADNGIGIPADRLGSVLEPFVQADGSTTRIAEGIGIGLTIVKKLVEQMNGTLHIESTEGEGTRVLLTFPLDTL